MKPFINLLIIMLFLSSINVSGQTNYLLNNGYSVTIHGGSNLHDWDETAGNVSGTGNISWNSNGSFDINAIKITVDVRSIKSSEGGIMNNKTYSALKASDHPSILFALASPLQSITASPGGENITAFGNLTIAGVTHQITIQAKVMASPGGNVDIDCSQPIKMSDYNIDPPTALFGMLKVSNETTIHFKIEFKKY